MVKLNMKQALEKALKVEESAEKVYPEPLNLVFTAPGCLLATYYLWTGVLCVLLGTLPNQLSRGQHLLLESISKTYCCWKHGAFGVYGA